jgi:hypothetical protein
VLALDLADRLKLLCADALEQSIGAQFAITAGNLHGQVLQIKGKKGKALRGSRKTADGSAEARAY